MGLRAWAPLALSVLVHSPYAVVAQPSGLRLGDAGEPPVAAVVGGEPACRLPQRIVPLPSSGATGLPATPAPNADAPEARATANASAAIPAPEQPQAAKLDYRQRLRPTAYGWPTLKSWCVWLEPAAASPDRWQQRWLEAVDRALTQWARLLPLQRVPSSDAAQIRIRRRRPTLQIGADGRRRASHGRAQLALQEVDRGEGLRLEPLVEIDLSPDQRAEALEATALHELGHAFGLWGHSDDPADVMAVRPGATPILRLSQRDRATLAWLYSQPTPFGKVSRDTGDGTAPSPRPPGALRPAASAGPADPARSR